MSTHIPGPRTRFYGTVSETPVIPDPTGGRRYWKRFVPAGTPQLSCRRLVLASANACGRAWAAGVGHVKRSAAREKAEQVAADAPARWQALFAKHFVKAALKAHHVADHQRSTLTASINALMEPRRR